MSQPHQLTPRFSDVELVAVAAAADAEGRTTTRYYAGAALAAARGARSTGPGSDREVLGSLQRELFAARTALSQFGTNVNRIAAAVNTKGVLPGHAAAAIRACAHAVEHLDEVTAEIRRRIR